ncbi:MAG TPA: response regulator [Bryocella sp.]|nr:response regulator [Bryocella sp.]
MRCLVVDDSSAMRAILHRLLAREGFEIVEARDGLEALSVIHGLDGLELVLIDWNMPVMNGLELLRRIRSEPRYDSARIVMVTTESDVTHIAEALNAGASEYIMKPFTPEIIADKLRLLGL